MSTNDFALIRILLVEDHQVVRAGLRLLIECRPGLIVVGEAGNRSEAMALAAGEKPDVILLDLDLGRENGLDFIRDLYGVARDARVLILTGIRDPEVHGRAVRLGAMGVVPKERATEVLIKAIEKVHAGEVWLERAMAGSVIAGISRALKLKQSDPEWAKIATLTQREREVISLVGEGVKNPQIAERLFISRATVRHHLSSVYGKLGVSDRFDLALYAYRHGLATPPANPGGK